jgi:hypothetical protein
MFHCSGIPEHCYGFPKDLEEQATFERLAAVSHLRRSLSSPSVVSVKRNDSRCALFILLAISCMISITQSAY